MMRIFSAAIILFLATMTIHAQSRRYIALGDSYTIGESVDEGDRWPNQLAGKLGIERPRIIATTGWRTDDLQNAIRRADLKNDYDLVSLLIGVNNQYQGKPKEVYAKEFEELLQTAIALAKGKKENVFIVSIPDYGYTPFGKAKQATISTAIDEFNAINKRISEKYVVRYFNITDLSREGLTQPSLVAPDGLHPSGKMYTQWVERIFSGLSH